MNDFVDQLQVGAFFDTPCDSFFASRMTRMQSPMNTTNSSFSSLAQSVGMINMRRYARIAFC
jgi:hypothetical protein